MNEARPACVFPMNDTRGRSDPSPGEAEAHLAKLNGQISTMRSVLVQLLQEVAAAEASIDHGKASLLLKANEELIVSAMDAKEDAEAARRALDESSRVGGLDPLTGLPNRTVLLDRFEQAISHAKRHGKRVALLFLDLDAFKQINDTLGHASGDHALRLVAGCLSSLVRETDTVSRHGGDEFLVLLAEVTTAADAEVVAEKVNAALAACSILDHQHLPLRASIGISVYPEDGEDARTLIARADAAMYLAKRRACAKDNDKVGASSGRPSVVATRPATPLGARSPRESDLGESEQWQRDLRDANESLVLAALGAQELLAAAEEVRRRQEDLLSLVAHELSDPFGPIRLAASTLGIEGAEATLLRRLHGVIDEQAERLARMVQRVMAQRAQGSD